MRSLWLTFFTTGIGVYCFSSSSNSRCSIARLPRFAATPSSGRLPAPALLTNRQSPFSLGVHSSVTFSASLAYTALNSSRYLAAVASFTRVSLRQPYSVGSATPHAPCYSLPNTMNVL